MKVPQTRTDHTNSQFDTPELWLKGFFFCDINSDMSEIRKVLESYLNVAVQTHNLCSEDFDYI